MTSQIALSRSHKSLPNASSAQKTIAVIGDAWTLKVIRALFRGTGRFGELLDTCGVSRAVLSDRLARLIEHEVVSREVIDGGHPSYELTPRGLDLWSLFLAMWLWETEWDVKNNAETWAPQVPQAQVTHKECGHAMRPIMQCASCQTPVSPFETMVLTQSTQKSAPREPVVASAFRKGRSHDALNRQAHKLIQVIGDRWSAAVVAAAFRGVKTFSSFEQELRIRPTQLSNRLAELVTLQILRLHPTPSGRHEYRLTKEGIALFPITLELVRWGNRWLSSDEDRLRVQHLPCESELVTLWCCGYCKTPLTRDALHFS